MNKSNPLPNPQIGVILQDLTAGIEYDVELPTQVTIGLLLPALLDKLKILGSQKHLLRNGSRLFEYSPNDTLGSRNTQPGDRLMLTYNIALSVDNRPKVTSDNQILEEIKLTAPVRIPAPEMLVVKLVPMDWLSHLEDARSDENRWNAIGWGFIGSSLGIIINWATSENTIIMPSSVVLLMVFLIMATLAIMTSRGFHGRAEKVRKDILEAGG